MAYTLAQAQLDLDAVNAAISDLISNKRRKKLQLGSHEFTRIYEQEDISYNDLVKERTYLQGIVATLTPIELTTPKFRPNTTFSLNVTNKPV